MAETGGPAFPPDRGAHHRGMDLRDYFAAMAMQGLLAGTAAGSSARYDFSRNNDLRDELAEHAYLIAQAMIKERRRCNKYANARPTPPRVQRQPAQPSNEREHRRVTIDGGDNV